MPITTREQLALAKRVRNHVRARPEQHDQGHWYRRWNHCGICGTTACIAGWTAILNGAELIVEQDWIGPVAEEVRTESGDAEFIIFYAQGALGLDFPEREYLFYAAEGEAVAYLGDLIAAAETRLSGASV